VHGAAVFLSTNDPESKGRILYIVGGHREAARSVFADYSENPVCSGCRTAQSAKLAQFDKFAALLRPGLQKNLTSRSRFAGTICLGRAAIATADVDV
jgi:hypothetical protein